MPQDEDKTRPRLRWPGGVTADRPLSELVLEHLRDGVAVLDMRGRVRWMNRALEGMIGYSCAEIRDHHPAEFILPPDQRPSSEDLARFRYRPDGGLFDRFRVSEHIRADGSRFWNQQSHALIDLGAAGAGDDPDTPQQLVVIGCRDITAQVETEAALHRAKDELEHAAFHDDLTGLANRKRLTAYMRSDPVLRFIREGQIGVLQIDLDKFKEINDTLGHAAGDATLRHVAAGLTRNAGPDDLVCRTGGDEFLLICARVSSQDALMTRAELVLRDIAVPLDWEEQTIHVGISIGASMPVSDTVSGEALIQQADQALYSAKNGGRGQVVFYSEYLGRRYRAQQKIARELRVAVEENQFKVYLQPQLRLESDTISGCEALIRWNHPERGTLLPGVFLEEARRSQLLADVDYISMNLALDALQTLDRAGHHNLTMSINVSSPVLADENYPGLLDWALQSRDLAPERICVEILETTILDGGELDVVTAVDRLRRLGVHVALDDFGTGYAGLAHMSAFEIDGIKLDFSMIRRLESDPRNRVITRSLIRLCGLLGMDVVAEGVETQGQLDILRRADCPCIQGFGLARPMPVADMLAWLDEMLPLPSPLFFTDRGPRAHPLALPDISNG
ncbi:putative bifunctional diguanylate cyclase/phosphodiesterase [Roseovarius sp. C7]|uniref:putative bifunctional diguanylate cyclase/phosphodiesterase n=1 Tax=Roseovarius sp. C7 TaxID=3398643 RepID=UPI0039F65AC3